MEDYSYARYLTELFALCRKTKLRHTIIGSKKYKDTGIVYPLYKIVIHPEQKKKICIVAGVHGYEIAGPLSILSLLRNYRRILRQRICYWIYPMINPVAFDLRQRYNDRGKDLNTINKKVLLSKEYKGAKIFYYDSKNENFDAFISLHEDVDREDFYAYVYEKKYEPVYRKIIQFISKDVRIWKAGKIYGAVSDGKGLIINKHDESFESRLFLEGRAKLSVCTETPGKSPSKIRIKTNLKNIKILSDYILKSKKT